MDDLKIESSRRKKPRSFNSFLSIANLSSNDGSSRNSISSIKSAISNILGFKSRRTQEQQPPIDLEFEVNKERSASHVAISPDGQYICTFDYKKLEFNIFHSITGISYSDDIVDPTYKFVKIPNLNASNDQLNPYKIDTSELYEYASIGRLREELRKTSSSEQQPNLNIPKSENYLNVPNYLNEKSNGISLENITMKQSQEKYEEELSRIFPSWSLSISNIMEHQGEHVIFVAVSAIIETDMKKKRTAEEDEVVRILNPNLNRYNSDEYANFNNRIPESVSDDPPDFEEIVVPKFDKAEGRTEIYRIVFDKCNHDLIQKPGVVKEFICHNLGGIIMFVEGGSDVQDFQSFEQDYYLTKMLATSCIIINAEGIFKVNYFEKRGEKLTFNSKFSVERFSFPKRLEKELKAWYKSKHCLDRLWSCIYHHYFFVDQYKDGVHTIEMYNLSTMEQMQIFINRHEESVQHTASHISSVFAVSQNKQLVACSNGEKSVTLFWIENGLDIGTIELGIETRILFLEFIDKDEKLLIITEEEVFLDVKEESKATNGENPIALTVIVEEDVDDSDNKGKQQIPIEKENSYYNDVEPNRVTKVKIWDLFSSSDDAVRTGMSGDLFPSKDNYHSHMARIPSKLYRMKDDGSLFSIIEHDGFVNLVNGVETDATILFGCTIFQAFETTPDQEENMPYVYSKHEEDTKLHKIFRRKMPSDVHKAIVDNKEPWVDINNYRRISAYLDADETIQLIIGHSTVQVWRNLPRQKKDKKEGFNLPKKEPVLEYIWANNIPTEHDTEDSRLQLQELWVGDYAFSLTVSWQYWEGGIVTSYYKRLSFPCKDGHVTPVLHACETLEHLNKRNNKIIDYKKMVEFEQIVEKTSRIVWRFIKKKPKIFKMMDVRYNVLSSLIRGGCYYLVKTALFGDMTLEELKAEKKNSKKLKKDDDVKNGTHKYKHILHIPRSKEWISDISPPKGNKPKYNKKSSGFYHRFISFLSEIIVWFYKLIKCKKKRNNNGIEEQSKTKIRMPTTDLEWAIEYCKGRERKDAIMVGYLLEYYSENALHHIGWMITISKALPLLYRYNLDYYVKALFYKECFADKELGTEYDASEIIPEHSKPRRNKIQDFKAFKPNTTLVSDKNHKPTLQVIFEFITVKLPRYYTDFVDNFDNDLAPPPIALRVVPLPNFTVHNIPKARVSYDWKSNLLRLLKILIIPRGYVIGREDKRLLTYAICFGVISWAYMSKLETTGHIKGLLIAVIACFYYLAYYLIAVEVLQALHHGFRESLSVSNMFDIISIITPCIVMSIFVASSLKPNGFVEVETSTGVVTGISFTMLLLWCELLLYLRLLSVFLLLSNPDINVIKPKLEDFNLLNADDTLTGLKMETIFDPTSSDDNPFASFLSSVQAAYFWINGYWSQKDDFDYWAIEILSLFASLLLVTVLQNMLIAFMGGVYGEAAEKGRDALLRYRATLISDYEALEDVRFWPPEPDPEYIFYVGHSRSFEDWSEGRKDFRGCMYQRYENRASYKKYKFKEDPSDKFSLLKYEMDKKCNTSSITSAPSMPNELGITIPLDESFKEFQQSLNNRLANTDQKIDTKIVELQTNMQEMFIEIMEKLEKIENKRES
ncbi:9378_t:CDS:10 [Funneliformis caledonium]|uniref:9378_t:CDS:1 n=1 Tax=Funneliformis caledonium TaxID=1117310 RepID=A0A9N9F0Y4_9GLOM|nr:9378_t:CDS:10 [Funneliformis caledonium]